MLSAIVVDDEKWICELIKKSIKWEEVGIQIVAESGSGAKAYDLIIKFNPDIVITDIRMPGMDGISLIKKVREAGIKCSFIIVSGYKDFEYARNALKFGVEDYLLKPIDERELKNTLIKLRTRILKDKEHEINEIELINQFNQSLDIFKEKFYMKLLYSNEQIQPDIEVINKENHMKLHKGLFQIVVFKLDYNTNEEIDNELVTLALKELQDSVRKELEKKCFDIFILKNKYKITCILNFSQENQKDVESSIKHSFNESKKSIDIFIQFNVSLGIGSIESEISLLHRSLESALRSIKCRIILGVDRIIDISQYKFESKKIRDFISIESEKKFKSFVETFNINETQIWLQDIFKLFNTKSNTDPKIILDVCFLIAELVFKTIEGIGIIVEKENYSLERSIEKLDNCISINELYGYLSNLINGLLDFCFKSKQVQTKKVIEITKKFISDHYSEEINLSDIANHVYLNSNYFSAMFKRETGVNYIDYLVNYRMDIARELLKNIEYNISQVSEMVGYKDSKYFSKTFKKIVGVNPEAYKKLFS